jgi:hypothetical protein
MDGDVCVCVSGCLPACLREACHPIWKCVGVAASPSARSCLPAFICPRPGLDGWIGACVVVERRRPAAVQSVSPLRYFWHCFFFKTFEKPPVCLSGWLYWSVAIFIPGGGSLFSQADELDPAIFLKKKVYSLPSGKRFRGRACSVRTIITG